MDKNFLEFWGNFLINSAKAQEQLEDVTKWMAQGLKGFEELSSMFRKFYGLDGVDEDRPQDVGQRRSSAEQFQKSFKDYLDLMGMVPKEEYLSLVKKYEGLKARVADQGETIKHLKTLLGQRDSGNETVVQTFQDLLKKQTDRFQELMENVGQLSKNDSHSTEGE